jgi:hypothetical protein
VHSNNFRHNTFWTSLKMFWVFFAVCQIISDSLLMKAEESLFIYFLRNCFLILWSLIIANVVMCSFTKRERKKCNDFFFVICTASVWMWINNDREEIIPSVVLDFIKRSGYAKDENSKIIFNIDLKYSVMLIETRGALWILTTSPWRLAVF